MIINSIFAREIIDSRGNPTVEVEIEISEGKKQGLGRASSPSGASTGKHEAVELRDGGKRFLGKGVLKAVGNINKIIRGKIEKKEFENAEEVDKLVIELDGTEDKSKIGANAMTALSMAMRKACARLEDISLCEYLCKESKNKRIKIPIPMLNIINGGKHAGGELAIQEFMIVPQLKTFKENIMAASEIYGVLGNYLSKKYGPTAKNVGDEGGYAPPINTAGEAFESMLFSIEETGYCKKVKLAIDAAASSFYKEKKYFVKKGAPSIEAEELLEYYLELVKKYPLISIEDPFEEEDFDNFSKLTKEVKGKAQVVGDDLLVTNPDRVKKAIEKKSCNALLLKINQIGTVTEALEVANMCKKENWNIVVSHRSGETEDTFIADFSAAIGAEYIKSGAPARGERTAKYNQLLRIEEKENLNI